MIKQFGRIQFGIGVVAVALSVFASSTFAIDTFSDWTGQNTNPANTTFTVVTTNNNYGLTSSTSLGGTVQSKN